MLGKQFTTTAPYSYAKSRGPSTVVYHVTTLFYSFLLPKHQHYRNQDKQTHKLNELILMFILKLDKLIFILEGLVVCLEVSLLV